MLRVTLHDPPLLPRPAHDELEDLLDPAPPAVYRWAIQRGWSVEQAGNLAAWMAGIPVVDGEAAPTSAWTLRSVGHLLFLRWLVETGRVV